MPRLACCEARAAARVHCAEPPVLPLTVWAAPRILVRRGARILGCVLLQLTRVCGPLQVPGHPHLHRALLCRGHHPRPPGQRHVDLHGRRRQLLHYRLHVSGVSKVQRRVMCLVPTDDTRLLQDRQGRRQGRVRVHLGRRVHRHGLRAYCAEATCILLSSGRNIDDAQFLHVLSNEPTIPENRRRPAAKFLERA